MTIILSKNGTDAVKIERTSVEDEAYIQEYIYNNPESLPLYEIKSDIRLLVLARELPTESGPMDNFAIDQDGEVYIVETKLYKNPDKRVVVGQVFDYGASLWSRTSDFTKFFHALDKLTASKFQETTLEKIQSFFDMSEEEAEQVIENIKRNITDGNMKFVVLMDKLEKRLQDIIRFINYNSRFNIYAVEFEFYKHNEQEIVIPKLYGAEVKKAGSTSSSSTRRTWTEGELLQDTKEKLSSEKFKAYEKLYNFCKEKADKINFGSGKDSSFSPFFSSLSNKSFITVYTGNSISPNFEWLIRDNPEMTKRFKEKLVEAGFNIPDDYTKRRPGISDEEWMPKVDDLIGVIEEMLAVN